MSETEGGSFELIDGPTSDLAFVARAPTLDALFAAASEALLAATVEDTAAVHTVERLEIALEEPNLELLLLRFLNELVWLRDAKRLLLCAETLHVTQDGVARLEGTLAGERISRERHALCGEVKAATAHGLRVMAGPEGFEARVTLDV